jgi:hypothetical protein
LAARPGSPRSWPPVRQAAAAVQRPARLCPQAGTVLQRVRRFRAPRREASRRPGQSVRRTTSRPVPLRGRFVRVPVWLSSEPRSRFWSQAIKVESPAVVNEQVRNLVQKPRPRADARRFAASMAL